MFEAVFPLSARPAEDVLGFCLAILGIHSSIRVSLYDEVVDRKYMFREVTRRQHFDIEVSGYRLAWGGVRVHNLSFLTAGGMGSGAQANLLSRLSHEMPLITARQYDGEYEHWQNAEDPLEYTAVRRSMEGLPMRTNGLPPPLDQMIVDTSRNAGRRIFRDGYVEAIGHRMWLGPEFFRRIPGASQEAVLSTPWLKVTQQPNSIVELVAHDEPFADDSTAELQNCLRELLFRCGR
jgi:hypothetical protein